MAKSKAQTHQTNGLQLSYSWIGTDIYNCYTADLQKLPQWM